MSPRSLIGLSLCLSLLAACSEQKKLNEMHDSTQSMEQTTQKMNNTTEDLSQKTEEMKNTTSELYDALRQGNALQLRRDAWDSILKAPSMYKKISEAGKYFMSYEVQLWNQYAQDLTVEKRDILAQQAAREFFLEIEDLAPADGAVNILAQPDPEHLQSAENRAASFNAMAAALHQINRKQLPALKTRPDLPVISMESIMEEALLAKKSLEAGTADLGTKEPAIREVLAHEAVAVQLLQTRYNFFTMMFIDAVTKISTKNKLEQLKMVALGWDLDLSALNAVQLDYYRSELLEQAVSAREVLKKIGVTPQMDGTLSRLLTKMQIRSAAVKGAHRAAEATQLVGVLEDLRKNH